MFNNPANIDYSLDEGTVTEVDVIRRLCKVKTLSGQNLSGIHWLQSKGGSTRGDDSYTPELGDRAVITSGLGYPIIIGYLPKLQTLDTSFPVNIDYNQDLVDTGSFSPASDSISFAQNTPKDRALGDRIFTSSGGGILGILRGGSILMRSSRLAEIFISKWDDVVRIVSRNFEHYTDLSSDFIRNLKGRVYRYTGYAKNQKDAKTENYLYNEYYGDVAIAEKAKTNLSSVDTSIADDRIYKEEIVTGAAVTDKQLMYREIHLDGSHDLKVVSQDGTLITQVRSKNNDVLITATSGDGILFTKALFTKSDVLVTASDNAGVLSKVYLTKTNALVNVTDGTNFTKGYFTKDEAKVTYNDQNTIKTNGSQINMNFNGGSDVNLNASGIQCTYSGAIVNLSSSGIQCTYSGHFMNVTSGGVALG